MHVVVKERDTWLEGLINAKGCFLFFVFSFISHCLGDDSGSMALLPDGQLNWAVLLRDGPFRTHFLAGVYRSHNTKAAFKCNHLAQQLRECAERAAAATPHDQKVCDIVRWEQLLCWSRYVAPQRFEALRACYLGKTLQERVVCDPAIFELHSDVETRMAAASSCVTLAERTLLSSCSSFTSAKSEDDANAALNCLCEKEGSRSLASCLKTDSVERCAEAYAGVLQRVGELYGKSLMLSNDSNKKT